MVTYAVDIGLRGGVATSAAEAPFAFNLKSSQSGMLDCDPDPSKGTSSTRSSRVARRST